MYPDYDDEYDDYETTLIDPFTGKRKRGRFEYSYEEEEPEPSRRGCGGNCAIYTLVASLMILAGVVGALIAVTYFIGEQPAPNIDSDATQSALFIRRTGTALAQMPPTVIVENPTHTLIPTEAPSATATFAPLVDITRRPTQTDTLPPLPSDTAPPIPSITATATHTVTPSPTFTPLATKTFDTLAQESGIPASIQLQNISCSPRSSSFTILFNHQDEAVTELILLINAVGTDARFIDITPTVSEIPARDSMLITRNGIPITFNVPTGNETFQELFSEAWAREEVEPPNEFGIYWLKGSSRPNIGFDFEAAYISGGITMTVEWTIENPESQTKSFDYKIC